MAYEPTMAILASLVPPLEVPDYVNGAATAEPANAPQNEKKFNCHTHGRNHFNNSDTCPRRHAELNSRNLNPHQGLNKRDNKRRQAIRRNSCACGIRKYVKQTKLHVDTTLYENCSRNLTSSLSGSALSFSPYQYMIISEDIGATGIYLPTSQKHLSTTIN